jgi:hypothetical protein
MSRLTAAKLVTAVSTWGFMLVFAAVLGMGLWTVRELRAPPVNQAFVIDSIQATPNVVEPNEPVRFDMTARRFHVCPSIIADFWIKGKGEDVQAWTRFPPATGGYTEVNTEGYSISFERPAPGDNTTSHSPPEPGIYWFKSINAPLCDGFSATETPPVSVCLVVPGLPAPACVDQMSALPPTTQTGDLAVNTR